jgi:hypothetical protein
MIAVLLRSKAELLFQRLHLPHRYVKDKTDLSYNGDAVSQRFALNSIR